VNDTSATMVVDAATIAALALAREVAANGLPLAVRPETAAALLSISRDLFDLRVSPELRWTQVGRLRLVSIKELSAWLERSSARDLLVGGAR
jgi:hypothetical protein